MIYRDQETPKPKCSSCKHWNNKQSELEYSMYYGICTCFKLNFDIDDDADCAVLDRQNRSDQFMGVNRFENQRNEMPIGAVNESRYCFVTNEDFCCVNHSEK